MQLSNMQLSDTVCILFSRRLPQGSAPLMGMGPQKSAATFSHGLLGVSVICSGDLGFWDTAACSFPLWIY